MKILLLGATGALGRRVAGELSRHDRVESLRLAGRNRDRAAWLADLLGARSPRIEVQLFDILDPRVTSDAMRSVDLVVSCAGPAHEVEPAAVRGAIAAGKPYISLANDQGTIEEVLELDEDARSADVTIVSGCGWSPGITNLLVALASLEVRDVEEVAVALAVSSAEVNGPATILQFARELTQDARIVADREATTERAATRPKLVYLPEPVGWVETFLCGHPEIVTLSLRHPHLRTLSCRLGLTEKAAMDLARLSMRAGAGASGRAMRLWARMMNPLKPLIETIPPRGPAWTAARVDVRGTTDGRHVTVSYGVVDHLANLVAVPLSEAALTIGGGSHDGGVNAPEDVLEPRAFLRRLSERGIRIARLEPYSL